MMPKTKVNLFLILTLVVLMITSGFFLIPNIFGDRMVPKPPDEYLPMVLGSADKYDVDPFVILGLCMQESGFNPKAVSSANARGMTQIVPSTATGIAKMIDKPSYDLFNPADSIEMGTAYLKSLVDRYGGNVNTALAAYNMGTGNVDPGYRLGYDYSNHKYAAGVSNYTRIFKELYPTIFDGVAKQLGITSQTDYKIKFEEVARKQGSVETTSSIWKAYFGKLFGLFDTPK